LNGFNVLREIVLRRQNPSVKKRNIVLKIETYQKLERYKVELMKINQNSKITYDDVVSNLLNKAMKGQF